MEWRDEDLSRAEYSTDVLDREGLEGKIPLRIPQKVSSFMGPHLIESKNAVESLSR